jgi:predicted GNAT family acetyltransferase
MAERAETAGAGRADELRVVDDPERHRYEAHGGGTLLGFVDYHLHDGLMTLLHTEIVPAAEGHGVGSRLVAATLDDIRRRGLRILVVCPFVRAYILRHPEYADLAGAP